MIRAWSGKGYADLMKELQRKNKKVPLIEVTQMIHCVLVNYPVISYIKTLLLLLTIMMSEV